MKSAEPTTTAEVCCSKSRKYRWLFSSLAVVALVGVSFWFLTHEQHLEGKTLNQWLDETTNGFAATAKVFSAHPEVSIPFLINEVRRSEPIKSALAEKVRKAPILRRWLQQPFDLQTKARAACLLGHIKPTSPQIVQTLSEALGDKNAASKTIAAQALHNIGAPAEPAIPALIACLSDLKVSATVTTSVIGIHEKLLAEGKQSTMVSQAWPKVQEQLTNAWTRGNALQLVALMGTNGAQALPELRRILADPNLHNSYDRMQAVRAVDRLGLADQEIISHIRAIATTERSKRIRQSAEEVLRKLEHADLESAATRPRGRDND